MGDSLLKTNQGKTILNSNFLSQNEKDEKENPFRGNPSWFPNHSTRKAALKEILFKEHLELTELSAAHEEPAEPAAF